MYDLQDVQSYTQNLAMKCPELSEEILFRQNAKVVDDSCAEEALISLPPVYKNTAKSWKLTGVSLGHFALHPRVRHTSDLETALVDINGRNETPAIYARARKMLIVAWEEADPICVGNASSDYPDTVFFMDTTTSPVFKVMEIASDFRVFIILAANLHQIAYSYTFTSDDKPAALDEACKALGCTDAQSQFWQSRLAELTS